MTTIPVPAIDGEPLAGLLERRPLRQAGVRAGSAGKGRSSTVAPRSPTRSARERRALDDARARGHLDVLLHVSRVLAKHDARDPARGLAELIVPAVGDWCTVDLVDGDGLRRVAAHHADHALAARQAGLRAADGRWCATAAEVARTGAARLLLDVRAPGGVSAEARAVLAGLGTRSVAIVPIRTPQRMLGVLTVATGPDRRSLRASDVTAFEELGNRVALAIDRDEAEDALVAARLQSVELEGVRRIAHDFGNLLTRIVGYTELAERQLLAGHPADEEIAEIRAAAEAAVRLTRVSTEISGAAPYGPQGPADAVEVATVLEPALRSLVGANQLRLVCSGPAPVGLDSSGVEHILRNLVANAGHGNDDRRGAATVLVSVGPAAGRAGYTTLRVADEGVGMDPDLLAACRTEGFTTRVGRGGSGQGLAMVELLVQHAGGELDIQSEPGVGTTVTVALPHPQ